MKLGKQDETPSLVDHEATVYIVFWRLQGAGAIQFAGLGGEAYKLPRAEYAPKHTSNTPCYFSNTLELVNSYVNSQMKHCLPEECVYSPQ